MKVFIFESINQVTSSWHPEGGLVIVAQSKERAKEMISASKDISVTESEWEKVVVIETKYNEEERIIVFPDAGCC